MKHLLLLFYLLCTICVSAQDVIVMKDGSTILSKVLEVNTSDVKYKKFSNQKGPTYTINREEIMSINYENGEKDIFKNNVSVNNANSTINEASAINSAPTVQNSSLIESYNQENHYAQKSTKKKTRWVINIAHVSNSSTLQNSDIEISLFQPLEYYEGIFKIKLLNLTDKMIYVDLGNSFRVHKDGTFDVYYENTVTLVSEGKSGSTGVGLNLGSVASVLGIGGPIGTLANGVNVGVSRGHSSSITKISSQERYITIPPNGSYILDDGEILGTLDTKRGLCVGEEKIYTESNSLGKNDYIFTYSFDKNFSDYGTIKSTVYLAKQIGTKFFTKEEAKKYITGLDMYTLWNVSYILK